MQAVGWNPRLRHPPDHQQLPQMPRIRPVGLRSLLVPAQRARRRRLTQMHPSATPPLLNDKPPTRRRLERDLELLTRGTAKKATHALPVRRRQQRPADFTSDRVDPLRRDLRSMLINPITIVIGASSRSKVEHLRELSALELRRPPTRHLCATSSTPGLSPRTDHPALRDQKPGCAGHRISLSAGLLRCLRVGRQQRARAGMRQRVSARSRAWERRRRTPEPPTIRKGEHASVRFCGSA